jgi:hypothetical protein
MAHWVPRTQDPGPKLGPMAHWVPRTQDPGPKLGPMTHWVPIYGSGPHRYLRPDPWNPIKVADPTHGAGTLKPTTRPAGSVCSLPLHDHGHIIL